MKKYLENYLCGWCLFSKLALTTTNKNIAHNDVFYKNHIISYISAAGGHHLLQYSWLFIAYLSSGILFLSLQTTTL
jgi:hypothetical protein